MINDLVSQLNIANFSLEMQDDKINQLKKRIKELELALRLYADKKTWLLRPDSDIAREIVSDDCSDVPGYSGHCGGKRARKALEKK